ncbi:MAG: Gldg family protein [Dehalococcoidia bacterium]|nr:Gldg family protein [Dehalococcoidia bacterium]
MDTVKSTGFWSAIGAVVGLVATIAGVVLFLTIDELSNFAISVLIIGLVLLFIALVLSPRAVAIFMAGRQGRYGTNVAIMTVAFFIILILINFLMFRSPSRLDVTATRIFSPAQQTLQVLDSLEGPIRANAFFSPTDADSTLTRQQAEDLLNEFARRSNNFTYRFIDPELNRSIAVSYDVTDFPVIVFEDIDTGVHQGVFSFTQQDFVTGILVVSGTQQKVVYHLTGHGESSITRTITNETDDEGFDFAIQGMQRDNYRVFPLNLKQDGFVPEDAAVLVIPGPKQNLDQDELQIVADYLAGGGKLIALLDPDAPNSYRELLAVWGLAVGNHRIADVISNVAGETTSPMVQRSNAQFGTSGLTGINIADQLNNVFFTDATAVLPSIPLEDLPAFMSYTGLARTTPASWMESHPEATDYNPGEDIQGPLDVAAVMQAGASLAGDIVPGENNLAKVIVIGDSDFARNKFFFQSDNANLLLNSVNWLAEDYELISIREPAIPIRVLVLNQRERDFIKWTGWFLPPILMLVIAVVVWWRRR